MTEQQLPDGPVSTEVLPRYSREVSSASYGSGGHQDFINFRSPKGELLVRVVETHPTKNTLKGTSLTVYRETDDPNASDGHRQAEYYEFSPEGKMLHCRLNGRFVGLREYDQDGKRKEGGVQGGNLPDKIEPITLSGKLNLLGIDINPQLKSPVTSS